MYSILVVRSPIYFASDLGILNKAIVKPLVGYLSRPKFKR